MQNRRFIIIHEVPDSVKSVVEPLRQKLSGLTGSREALSYPVHITLRTGMIIPGQKVDEVLKRFMIHCSTLRKFKVHTDGYLFMEYGQDEDKKYLAGLKIDLDRNLFLLHRDLLDFSEYKKGLQGEFRPHISLVYDDLSKDWYERLKKDQTLFEPQRPLNLEWTLNNIGVWEFDGIKWVCRGVMEVK